jgi:hypothetical protein
MKGHGKDLSIALISMNIVFSILLYIFSTPLYLGLLLNLVAMILFFTTVFILVRGVAKAIKVLSILLILLTSIIIFYIFFPRTGYWALAFALIFLFLMVFVFRIHHLLETFINNCQEKKCSDINGMVNPNAFPFGMVSFPEAERNENIIIFNVLHIIGSAGLLFFIFFDKLLPAIGSVKEAGLIITFFIFVYGVSVLFLGYIKGMAVPVFIIAMFILFIKTNDILVNIEALNYPETVIFRIMALMAYTVLVYYIISWSYWKYLVGYPMFNDERDMVGVYMLLADYLPVAGYDDLTTFSFKIEITDEELSSVGQIRKIEHLLHDTQTFCYRNQVVFAGYRISLDQETMMLYFYTSSRKTETFKTRYYRLLCHYTNENIIINQAKDSQYLVFKNELFPNDYQLQEMYAQIVYDKCVEEGFDLDEQYGIQYLISLYDEKYLTDCLNDLHKEGFNVRRTPEEDFYDEELDLYFYTLVIEHQSNIGIDRLKYNTKTIINIIAKYDGNIENWNILWE